MFNEDRLAKLQLCMLSCPMIAIENMQVFACIKYETDFFKQGVGVVNHPCETTIKYHPKCKLLYYSVIVIL